MMGGFSGEAYRRFCSLFWGPLLGHNIRILSLLEHLFPDLLQIFFLYALFEGAEGRGMVEGGREGTLGILREMGRRV